MKSLILSLILTFSTVAMGKQADVNLNKVTETFLTGHQYDYTNLGNFPDSGKLIFWQVSLWGNNFSIELGKLAEELSANQNERLEVLRALYQREKSSILPLYKEALETTGDVLANLQDGNQTQSFYRAVENRLSEYYEATASNEILKRAEAVLQLGHNECPVAAKAVKKSFDDLLVFFKHNETETAKTNSERAMQIAKQSPETFQQYRKTYASAVESYSPCATYRNEMYSMKGSLENKGGRLNILSWGYGQLGIEDKVSWGRLPLIMTDYEKGKHGLRLSLFKFNYVIESREELGCYNGSANRQLSTVYFNSKSNKNTLNLEDVGLIKLILEGNSHTNKPMRLVCEKTKRPKMNYSVTENLLIDEYKVKKPGIVSGLLRSGGGLNPAAFSPYSKFYSDKKSIVPAMRKLAD